MRLVAILVGALSASQVNAQQVPGDRSGVYHCRPTARVGIAYNKADNAWEPKSFNVKNTDFLLKLTDTGQIEEDNGGYRSRVYRAGLKQFGDMQTKKCWSREPRHYGMEEIILGGLVSDTVYCGADGQDYQVDLRNNRYRVLGKGDFISGIGEPNDPEFVEVGRCEKID
ncbi:hypothetical protein ELI43_24345 [Rhizobium leguminosarum]|uniref:hypothetical protein n=1 Tax=Rhizobium leguminosarum TaxID=384 RepID=UPI00103019D5|nr:hypothetical protein [Rhizobium leguminosarum]TAU55732.1 hypothetical protein ELI43_24345 [Rhizobium leguminosarum]